MRFSPFGKNSWHRVLEKNYKQINADKLEVALFPRQRAFNW